MTASIISRAFDLARSGDYSTVEQVKKQLLIERFDNVRSHFDSRTLVRELRAILASAENKGDRAESPPL